MPLKRISPTNFNQIVDFAHGFKADALLSGAEYGFVFSEIGADGGLKVESDYPSVRENLPPDSDYAANVLAYQWVDVGGGYVPITSLPGFVRAGRGIAGALQSGVYTSSILATWNAKNIAAGYIIATGATLDQINTDRTSGLALIRTYVNDDETDHPLAPSEPFTSGQITALSTWLNNHSITNAEFAALFGVTAAQVSNWLQTHERREFAQVIHDQFA